jgi:hypothetical protein
MLFLCLASSNISKGHFQKEAYHLFIPISICNYALQNSLRTAKFTAHRAEDVVVQRMLSRRECRHAEDVVAQRMLSRKGCCRAVDFVAQWVVAHRMLSCKEGCRA